MQEEKIMTIKEINNLINEEKKRNEEENKAARQEFEKEMKAITMEESKKTEKASMATPLAMRIKGAYFPFTIAHPTRTSMMQPKIIPAMKVS